MSSTGQGNNGQAATGWLALVAALWLQLYFSCTYAWRYGDYYSYGWYVPPLVVVFFVRLRHLWKNSRATPVAPAIAAAGLVILIAVLTILRILNQVDPRWTLPIWIQAGVVIIVTLLAIYRTGGTTITRRFLPVIAFACSAIPLPTVLEKLLVSSLTGTVITSSVWILEAIGQPVRAIGDQIGRMGEVVHVTEGCSGIKSAQSFLMAALFFGEWMTLKTSSRWLMILVGLATAWVLNVLRASALAWIRFEKGEAAFDRAHDLAGLVAFALGSSILLAVSYMLDREKSPRRIVRSTVEGRPA